MTGVNQGWRFGADKVVVIRSRYLQWPFSPNGNVSVSIAQRLVASPKLLDEIIWFQVSWANKESRTWKERIIEIKSVKNSEKVVN